MIHGGGRINTAMPQDTPIHDHHPTGSCKTCLLWSPIPKSNQGLCVESYENTDSDWSCKFFLGVK